MAMSEEQHPVLVVEDDPDIREVTIQLLEDLGYQTRAAENGQQALGMLRTMEPLPCLILLDLMMPIMNGWQVLEALKEEPKLAHIPVVVMSAVADISATTLNVAAYLRKPASYDQLIQILKHHC